MINHIELVTGDTSLSFAARILALALDRWLPDLPARSFDAEQVDQLDIVVGCARGECRTEFLPELVRAGWVVVTTAATPTTGERFECRWRAWPGEIRRPGSTRPTATYDPATARPRGPRRQRHSFLPRSWTA
jgi:hypothetical protein